MSLNSNWHECIWIVRLGNVVPFHMIWFCFVFFFFSVFWFGCKFLRVTNAWHGKKCREKWETDGKKRKKPAFYFFVITYFCLNRYLLHGISRRSWNLILCFNFFRYGKSLMILLYGRNYSIQLFRWICNNIRFTFSAEYLCGGPVIAPCFVHNNVPLSIGIHHTHIRQEEKYLERAKI